VSFNWQHVYGGRYVVGSPTWHQMQVEAQAARERMMAYIPPPTSMRVAGRVYVCHQVVSNYYGSIGEFDMLRRVIAREPNSLLGGEDDCKWWLEHARTHTAGLGKERLWCTYLFMHWREVCPTWRGDLLCVAALHYTFSPRMRREWAWAGTHGSFNNFVRVVCRIG